MRTPKPRPELQNLRPYRTSETATGRIFLHANENPYPLPREITDEILEAAAALELNRYPDAEVSELRNEIAGYAGVDPSWIWIGDGANEVLLQACLAYGGPGRTSLHFEPSYVMHHRQAGMAATRMEVLRRTDNFSIDIDTALESIDRSRPDVVFVCSPNNPTGTVTPIDDIRRIARSSDALIIVDEAYFEFSGASLVPYLAEHPNVIVVRTLSKAFRLAGVRLGYGIASPDLLEELGRVRMPYGQSAFTQLAATVVLRHREKVLETVSAIIAERERLGDRLGELPGVEMFASGANFVFFRHPNSSRLLEGLAAQGIVIRDFSYMEGCDNCLRVTAGRPDENDEFLEAAAALS